MNVVASKKRVVAVAVAGLIPASVLIGTSANPAQAAPAPLGCKIKVKGKTLNAFVSEYRGSGKCGKQKLTIRYSDSGFADGTIGKTKFKLALRTSGMTSSLWKGKLGKHAFVIKAKGQRTDGGAANKTKITADGTLRYRGKTYTFTSRGVQTSKGVLTKSVNYQSTTIKRSGKTVKNGTTPRTLAAAFFIANYY